MSVADARAFLMAAELLSTVLSIFLFRTSFIKLSSVLKMANYWGRMNQAYGLGESAVAFDPDTTATYEGLHTLHSLTEIENWIAADGKVS